MNGLSGRAGGAFESLAPTTVKNQTAPRAGSHKPRVVLVTSNEALTHTRARRREVDRRKKEAPMWE
jgi:hypothetical protein